MMLFTQQNWMLGMSAWLIFHHISTPSIDQGTAAIDPSIIQTLLPWSGISDNQ